METYTPIQIKLAELHAQLSWSHMAAESGISATTIKRFAHNETRRPQFHTVEVLADYAGFRLAIKDMRVNSVLKLKRIK